MLSRVMPTHLVPGMVALRGELSLKGRKGLGLAHFLQVGALRIAHVCRLVCIQLKDLLFGRRDQLTQFSDRYVPPTHQQTAWVRSHPSALSPRLGVV